VIGPGRVLGRVETLSTEKIRDRLSRRAGSAEEVGMDKPLKLSAAQAALVARIAAHRVAPHTERNVGPNPSPSWERSMRAYFPQGSEHRTAYSLYRLDVLQPIVQQRTRATTFAGVEPGPAFPKDIPVPEVVHAERVVLARLLKHGPGYWVEDERDEETNCVLRALVRKGLVTKHKRTSAVFWNLTDEGRVIAQKSEESV
jgi:Ni,Fe-hydrogenase maturation factor